MADRNMVPDSRAEFEAWAKQAGWPHSWGYSNTNKIGFCSASWNVWQAAAQRQQERIAKMERDLQFVERWANHHGAKPHITAKEALSVIQHYPSITRITRGYADGVVPDTFDPYARIAELEAQVQALSRDAGRWQAMRQCLVGADFAPEMGGGPVVMFELYAKSVKAGFKGADEIADAAIAAGKGEA